MANCLIEYASLVGRRGENDNYCTLRLKLKWYGESVKLEGNDFLPESIELQMSSSDWYYFDREMDPHRIMKCIADAMNRSCPSLLIINEY